VSRTCRFCWEPLAECVCPEEDPATETLKQTRREILDGMARDGQAAGIYWDEDPEA